jgi:hypothetical protein
MKGITILYNKNILLFLYSVERSPLVQPQHWVTIASKFHARRIISRTSGALIPRCSAAPQSQCDGGLQRPSAVPGRTDLWAGVAGHRCRQSLISPCRCHCMRNCRPKTLTLMGRSTGNPLPAILNEPPPLSQTPFIVGLVLGFCSFPPLRHRVSNLTPCPNPSSRYQHRSLRRLCRPSLSVFVLPRA